MPHLNIEIKHGTFYVGETTEGTVCIPEQVFSLVADSYDLLNGEHWKKERAFFGRLSANGYTDSTEWTGPYYSKEMAREDLESLYGADT